MSVETQRRFPVPSTTSRSASTLLARYGIVFVLFVLLFVLTILTPIIRGEQYFLRPSNLINVLLQTSINAIIAVGMTFVITSGGIDLSVGSIVALGAVCAAGVMRNGVEPLTLVLTSLGMSEANAAEWIRVTMPFIGFGVAVLAGLLCGVLNGTLITRFNLPPFIATLGTLGIFRGLALILSEARPIYGFGGEYFEVFSATLPIPLPAFIRDERGEAFVLSLPSQVIIAVIVAAVFWFVLTQTRFGKYTVAIGGNEETTRLAGIPVRRYKRGIYLLSGLLSGVAAALLLARLRSGDPTYGVGFELDAIAATVMGGTSLSGGEGTIAGTIVGALIIGLVRNAMNLFNLQSYWQEVVIGTVIVLAVMLDQWRKRQTQRE